VRLRSCSSALTSAHANALEFTSLHIILHNVDRHDRDLASVAARRPASAGGSPNPCPACPGYGASALPSDLIYRGQEPSSSVPGRPSLSLSCISSGDRPERSDCTQSVRAGNPVLAVAALAVCRCCKSMESGSRARLRDTRHASLREPHRPSYSTTRCSRGGGAALPAWHRRASRPAVCFTRNRRRL